uniref:Uncharacterized protein n=1 Tax=Bubo bubo TaxID=30461 RepID=A0A8C0F9X2_BUBBB
MARCMTLQSSPEYNGQTLSPFLEELCFRSGCQKNRPVQITFAEKVFNKKFLKSIHFHFQVFISFLLLRTKLNL